MSRKVYNVSGEAVTKFPFSHAVESEDLLFLSGQPPMELETGKFIDGDFESQLKNCFKNLFEVVAVAGLTEEDVVKCTVFLIDMRDYPLMNEVYKKQFSAPLPARSCFAVSGLPLGARVEVEMIARKGKKA